MPKILKLFIAQETNFEKYMVHIIIVFWNFAELDGNNDLAVINSADELKFIRSKLKDLVDIEDFFIGGSANRNTYDTGILEFSEYMTDSSGKKEAIYIL